MLGRAGRDHAAVDGGRNHIRSFPVRAGLRLQAGFYRQVLTSLLQLRFFPPSAVEIIEKDGFCCPRNRPDIMMTFQSNWKTTADGAN